MGWDLIFYSIKVSKLWAIRVARAETKTTLLHPESGEMEKVFYSSTEEQVNRSYTCKDYWQEGKYRGPFDISGHDNEIQHQWLGN